MQQLVLFFQSTFFFLVIALLVGEFSREMENHLPCNDIIIILIQQVLMPNFKL